MKRWPPPRRLLALLAALAAAVPAARSAPSVAASAWWGGLGIHDLGGAILRPAGRWLVVVLISQDCPVSNASVPVVNALAAEFGPRGFAFVGAYVDPTADLPALRAHAADYALGFAAADDRGHRLARAAGATYTPEAAVFTAAGGLLYRGRIDDRVGALGATRPAATHQDLRDVLVAVAGGAAGPFKGVAGYGCAIPEAVGP